MTVKKTFAFASSKHEELPERAKVEIDLAQPGGKTETFELRNDLTGIELLEAIANASGGPGSTRGVALFLRRVVKEDDWDRFVTANKGATPEEIGELAGELIDAYSSFGTTEDEGSSTG